MPTSTVLLMSTWPSASSTIGNRKTREGKEKHAMQIGLFTEDMILYTRDPKVLPVETNSAMWQDTESACTYEWLFYTPTINTQRRRSDTIPSQQSQRK